MVWGIMPMAGSTWSHGHHGWCRVARPCQGDRYRVMASASDQGHAVGTQEHGHSTDGLGRVGHLAGAPWAAARRQTHGTGAQRWHMATGDAAGNKAGVQSVATNEDSGSRWTRSLRAQPRR